MKFLIQALLIFSVVSSSYAVGKNRFLGVEVNLPKLYGDDIKASLWLQDEVNTVVGPSEVRKVIENIHYMDNYNNAKTFKPEDGEVVLVPRENLINIITTDVLKGIVGQPYFKHGNDIYPVALKFRSKFVGKEFKRISFNIVRPLNSQKWGPQYKGLVFNSIKIDVSYAGSMRQIVLEKNGEVVKVVYPKDLTTIPFEDF